MKSFKPFPGQHSDTKHQAYGDPMTRAFNGESSDQADKNSELAFAVDESEKHLRQKAAADIGHVVRQIDLELAGSNPVSINAPTVAELGGQPTQIGPDHQLSPGNEVPVQVEMPITSEVQSRESVNA